MEAYAEKEHVPIINERGRHAFLRIIEECKPRQVLEIGTAIGYSALLMAEQGADDIHITTLELSEREQQVTHKYEQMDLSGIVNDAPRGAEH